MDLPQSQLEKAKKAIEILSGLALDQGESSNSLASIYPCEKDAALALNASALEEALQTLRAAFVSAG